MHPRETQFLDLRYLSKVVISGLMFVAVSGCVTLSRQEVADNIGISAGFKKEIVTTDYFALTVYTKITQKNAPVNIYIEGDGFAFVSRSKISSDPTPTNPLTLKLAAADPSKNIVYIARPCQYTDHSLNKVCREEYWSSKRFSAEVIKSIDQAISYIVNRDQFQEVHLIGFSGGAAVAVLVAAQRNDISSIRTVSGNLDHVAVSRYHNVSLLGGSLNPIDVAPQIKNIPQRHFIGANDKIVPLFISERFLDAMGASKDVVTIVKGCSHQEGWVKQWHRLLQITTYPPQQTENK